MNLLIDIGNSTTKVAAFDSGDKIAAQRYAHFGLEQLVDFIDLYPGFEYCLLASSGDCPPYLYKGIEKRVGKLMELNHDLNFPIEINYRTPETLGVDRIALAVGAHVFFPQSDVLVVDVGTAITYELLTAKGEYLGGNISPGMNIRYRALNNYTDKLPLLSPAKEFPFWGDSTKHAIVSGVQSGILFEIEGYINSLKVKYPELKVVLTGGDSFFFAEKLKNSIFAETDLLFHGLNKILEYNTLIDTNE